MSEDNLLLVKTIHTATMYELGRFTLRLCTSEDDSHGDYVRVKTIHTATMYELR